MTNTTLADLLAELNASNLDEALASAIKLKLGYQPWRDRRTELLTQRTLSDAERQELKEIEAKLMPVGWRASLCHSHEDVQAMEIIRKAAKILDQDSPSQVKVDPLAQVEA